jgi:hypothetical protein
VFYLPEAAADHKKCRLNWVKIIDNCKRSVLSFKGGSRAFFLIA